MAVNTQLNTATVPVPVSVTTVTLSAVNIAAMWAAPVVLVAAQGANTCIVVHDVFNEYIFNTAEYTDGDPPQIQYGNTAADINSTPIFMYASNIFTLPASTFYSTNGSETGGVILAASGCVNEGVYISNFTAPFAGGDSTAKVTVLYSVVTTT